MPKKKKNQIVKVTKLQKALQKAKVNAPRLKKELKDKLDKIDENTKKEFIKGFYESRLRIELAMWKKGKAIDVFFRGVKNTISYYELEKRTGRRRANLKQWHELYEKYPEMNAYKQIAVKKAQSWTKKVYYKMNALTDGETKQLPEDTETSKQLEAGENQPKPKKKKSITKNPTKRMGQQYAKESAYSILYAGIEWVTDRLQEFRKKYELSDLRSSVLLGDLKNTIDKIYGEQKTKRKAKSV